MSIEVRPATDETFRQGWRGLTADQRRSIKYAVARGEVVGPDPMWRAWGVAYARHMLRQMPWQIAVVVAAWLAYFLWLFDEPRDWIIFLIVVLPGFVYGLIRGRRTLKKAIAVNLEVAEGHPDETPARR